MEVFKNSKFFLLNTNVCLTQVKSVKIIIEGS